jgi:selenoprotein W-related protein
MTTSNLPVTGKSRIEIEYCTQCRWMLRATWLAQEILQTFDEHISEIALRPGSGGVFRVRVNQTTVWDRAADGAMPELRILKLRIRDIAAPEKSLGHTDRVSEDLNRDA